MTKFEINTDNGDVILPAGYTVSSSVSQDEFRESEIFSKAESRTYNTFPWIHYVFSGGNISGRDLLASLCFYDQMLVSLNLSADFYPPGPKDWSGYSMDIETAAKEFHDSILEEMLGAPSESGRLPGINLDAAHKPLARPLKWSFPWGTVRSSYDFKGGGTYIIVSYGNRQEEANKEYNNRLVR